MNHFKLYISQAEINYISKKSSNEKSSNLVCSVCLDVGYCYRMLIFDNSKFFGFLPIV